MIYVNFLPWRLQLYQRKKQQLLIIFLCCSISTLSILLAYQLSLTRSQQQLTQQLNALAEIEKQINQHIRQLSQQQNSNVYTNTLFQSETSNLPVDATLPFLTQVITLIPNTLWLETLTLNHPHWQLTGQSLDYQDIVLFYGQLPHVQRVDIQKNQNYFQFEITGNIP